MILKIFKMQNDFKMPACGQAVGCGVCDTPELWRGAAGLCARVRACAGAAESLQTNIHTPPAACCHHLVSATPRRLELGLYKIFVHFNAFVNERIVILLPLPPARPALLQYYCTTTV